MRMIEIPPSPTGVEMAAIVSNSEFATIVILPAYKKSARPRSAGLPAHMVKALSLL